MTGRTLLRSPTPSRKSALDHLSALPDAFDLTQFCLRSGIAPESAKVMLSRWAARGLVSHAGPKAGIYYKMLGRTWDDSEQRVAAALAVFPGAMLMGASVLHAHGWTHQVPRRLELAVPVDAHRSVQLFDVHTCARPRDWFMMVHGHSGVQPATGDSQASPWQMLPKLRPSWALADLLAHPEGWVPDADDLDIPGEAATEIELACETLGVSESDFRPLLEHCVPAHTCVRGRSGQR